MFITFCYKGYSITNSTKIIHRYLAQEPSELLIYYLWLVLPFCRQLKLLALNSKEPVSPYLWAAKEPREALRPPLDAKATRLPSWDSSRLSKVLQHDLKASLNTTANITLWRHTAITISRKHLGGAKFKRDYGSEPAPSWVTEQTGYTAYIAGNIYMRGIEEAPGYVVAACTEYRALSRTWHSFLGFSTYLGVLPPNSLKRPRDNSSTVLLSSIRDVEYIKAEVQRRVKAELKAGIQRRITDTLLQISNSGLLQPKRRRAGE
jgi:hypothetical protein